MKRILFLLALLCLEKGLNAQYVYTIKADSVKITNSCDTAELIIENHTQSVPGFLFNKGRGRTEFRKVLSKIDDSSYVIGIDTLKLSVAWLQGGNRFGATGKFGTLDNNHIDFYTNNTKRGRWTNAGNLLISTETDNGNRLQVNGRSWFGNDLYFSNPTYATGGMGAGLQWVGNNMFQIYGGPAHESLTFGPENQIHSSVGISAPWFYGTSTLAAGPSYFVPMEGGSYSTPGSGSNATKVYHTFTNTPPEINSSNGEPTLMEINKMVNRGVQDGLETGLRIKFTINGIANNLRALETVNGEVRLHTGSGRTSIGLDGSSTITSRLDVSGETGYNQFRLRKKYTPMSTSDTNGSEGDMSWDDNYIYIKTAEGWKRSALSTF